jgi:DNA-binding transcriptional ArsR family regulator
MDSGGGRITLDQESFRALASDVRVGILKRLDTRRETVTDLSTLLGLSKPTLLEHLEKLQSAGLVKRVDEGRKWIYYALTDKGRKILHPERVAITLALASAVVLAAIGAFYGLFSGQGFGFPERFTPIQNSSAPTSIASTGPNLALVALAVAGGLSIIAFLLRLYGNRRRERFFQQLGVA